LSRSRPSTCLAVGEAPTNGGAYSLRRAPVAIALSVLLAACVPPTEEDSVLFERAEQHYSHGDYDGARALYAEFVERHPLSPFHPIAVRRLAIIERELDSVAGGRGAPAPVRVNPYAATPVPEPTEAPIEVRVPSIPSLGR
jgi:hypothetical protein